MLVIGVIAYVIFVLFIYSLCKAAGKKTPPMKDANEKEADK